ncbi:MAG: hypothetical protein ABTA16_18115, partial [Niallia sp.]
MGDSKSYSAHDIEKLKQKVETYRDTLTTLRTGNSIDDYLFMKSEFNGFKTQISNLEGILKEKQSMQIGEYEQQVKNFSVQIDSLNQTVEELNQDISLIMNKIKSGDSNNFIEEINAPVNAQDSLNIASNEEKAESLIEKTIQTKDQTSISSIQQPNRPPSFKQLQNLVTMANDIQEVPSDAPPLASLDIQKTSSEGQRFSKKSFPSTGINPSQIYNSRSRNVPMTPVIHPNRFSKKQIVPIKVNEISTLSSSLAIGDSATEYSDGLKNVASLEGEVTAFEISN